MSKCRPRTTGCSRMTRMFVYGVEVFTVRDIGCHAHENTHSVSIRETATVVDILRSACITIPDMYYYT